MKDHDSASISHLGLEDLFSTLETDVDKGLTTEVVDSRLKQYGQNRLTESKKKGFLDVLLEEIREPMIIILIVIALIYSFIGNPADSIAIVVIVLIVVIVEVFNINRARKSIEALKALTSLSSVVYRDGGMKEVKSRYIVPGDVIILSAGDRIPADGRLVDSYNTKVDESSLTGESFPVSKDYLVVPQSNDLAELSNMVFSGTLMVQGTAKMVVTSTGRSTEIGRISELVEEAEEPVTPLESSMNALAFVLAFVALFFSVSIPVIGYFEGQPIDLMIITALSLAFATVPEELPIVISVTLAVGAYALSRKNAIVRSLKAAETLGNVTIIATDKTGTLTENKMSVGHIYYDRKLKENDHPPDNGFQEISVLCTGTLLSDIRVSSKYKDPMEVAVLEYMRNKGVDIDRLRRRFETVEEFGFDNRIKMSSNIYTDGSSNDIYVSGAPEVILLNSVRILEEGVIREMTPEDRERAEESVESLTGRGERIIAVSFREGIDPGETRENLEKDLTFVGLISFIDPPRKEVKNAINQCQKAGIRVIMLTGDHPRTAKTIAQTVGINHDGKTLTGKELQEMSDQELKEKLSEVSIYARITSEDKLRIVNLLENRDEIVAVTGDGVNDAPALQTAQIGISMGIRGTDVAKEASDMVLMDDNFSTIVDAVREGRKIFHTLRKGVRYYITVKLSLVSIFVIPLILSIPFPFSPIQIIIIELFMDVAALGGFVAERGESGLMDKPSKGAGKKFLDKTMINGIAYGSAGLVVAVTLIYLYIYFVSGSVIEAQTAAFSTWILSHVFLAQNLRTENEPLLRKGFFSNRIILLWGLGVVLALIVITIFPDLQILLSTASLTAQDWIMIVLASVVSTFWMEVSKLIKYNWRKGRKAAS